MGQALGYNSFFGWAQESTFGTAVAAAKWLEIESESIKNGRKFEPVSSLRFRGQSRKIAGPKKVGGPVMFPALWTGWEQILKHAMGSVNTTGAGPFTHTFSLAAALPTGLTAYVNRDAAGLGGSSEFRYAGCKVNKLTLSQKYGEVMKVAADLVGAGDVSPVAASTPTYPTFAPIDYSMMTEALLNPSTDNITIKIREIEISIDNGLVDMRRLGNVAAAAFLPGSARKVSWKVDAEFDTDSFTYMWDKFRSTSETDFRFKWVSATQSLTITLPKVTFDGNDPESKDAGPLYVPFEGTAWVNAADNDECSIVLVNGTSSVG